MKKVMLAACLAFGVLGASCDDDDNPPPRPVDAGGDTRSDGGMCIGTFAALTRAQLGAVTNPMGKCASTTDLDYICTADLNRKARECGVTCIQLGTADPNCVTTCLTRDKTLSASCADCYQALVGCSAMKCPICLTDPTGDACRGCQVAQGCFGAFFACSGLPSGAPPPDAGAEVGPDVPADTAGTPDVTAEVSPADVSVEAAADVPASPDAAPDAVDAGADAGADAGVDAGADAAEVGGDAADAGADAGDAGDATAG